MDDSERPRKLQKTAHDMTSPATEGLISTTTSISTPDGNTAENHGATESNGQLNITLKSIPETDENGQPLSKNQRKKLLKRERWAAGKEWRKEKRKEKIVAKKERQRAAKAQTAAQDGVDPDDMTLLSRSERKKVEQQRSVLLPIAFVIDCDFDDLMVEKERISLGSQITRSYSDNAKAQFRAHMFISSFNKRLKERFDTVLSKQYTRWKGATFMEEDYVVAAEQARERMRKPTGGKMMGMFAGKDAVSPDDGEVIYLSSDSPNTLTELKPFSTYIIGGLVDKNRHKGVCYKSAMGKGIKTAKLPIGDYMQMQSRYVLATNHVIEIMIRWLELGDWGTAFCLVLPKRKGGVLKDNPGERHDQEDDDQGAEADEGDAPASEVKIQEAVSCS
ncbi:tRNA m(1)G methyltransferase domain-containing protein [Histoplasma capsulatum G186AR]|uniref:tRNA (guanine(9)-N1)-methyltransferase n=2 Tax=Ajellomyces capsulatus TaxID=5037 RepID=C0NAW6_AJECG|nr:tRNA m(1)G methyltransferase domain-containing protein [Histoplasma capsulatum G186AR]EEH10807.1 tRNA m(1)G methyltransferase domain-containing protein [Histoplasma capsulatum G186AR]KAG5288686.1 tRNA m(1)G methyltransferase domain-containing protein [Histoplasma capsulatum]QSS71262.1 tRNA m(1)G methyltransferase domain-containing protein [Histoplasma capsulatum G186AR]